METRSVSFREARILGIFGQINEASFDCELYRYHLNNES